jgi:anti-sigma-K factor RskA
LTDLTEDQKATASEFVMGLLGGEHAYRFEQFQKKNPAADAEVAFWEENMAAVLAYASPADPPKDVLNRVERTLFGSIERQSVPAGAPFPWKKLVLGVVMLKVTLVLLWYLANF